MKTGNLKNRALITLVVISFLSIAVMLVTLLTNLSAKPQTVFTPPPFDSTAVVGTPNVPENLGWSQIYQEGMEFRASVCGVILLENGAADVYFTNDPQNVAWLKLRILDDSDNIVAQTGLIKPGEYVQSIAFDTSLKTGANIKLKIMAYEPQTYYSLGAVTLNTVLGTK